MDIDNLSSSDIEEIRIAAKAFKREAWLTGPRIFSGHPVAHQNPDRSEITNFSTITRLVTLESGRKVFLVYRYPLSWIHSITDGIQRIGSGKWSRKPLFRLSWHRLFTNKSRIPTIAIMVPGVVAMPYEPNWNLWDILKNRVADIPAEELLAIFSDVVDQVNELHRNGQSWGELIVNNIILSTETLKPVICDTEVTYCWFTEHRWQCMSDWHDLIFSACGALNHHELTADVLAKHIFSKIDRQAVRDILQDCCAKGRTIGHKIFWPGVSGRLSCDKTTFDAVSSTIAGL